MTGALRTVVRDAGPSRLVVAVCIVAVPVLGLVFNDAIRHAEACLSASLVRLVGLPDAYCAADSAFYTIDGRTVGHSVTAGCSFVLLTPPFAGLCAFLALVRRIAASRPVVAFVGSGIIVLVANQTRMVAIVSGMRAFGPERGYGMTHVLVGTLLSVLGTGAAALFLLIVLTRSRRPAPARKGRQRADG